MFNNFSLSARRFAMLTSCGLLLASTACQKEENVLPSVAAVSQSDVKIKEPTVAKNGKHLKFADRQAFENTMASIGKLAKGESVENHLDKWEKEHNFVSKRSSKNKIKKEKFDAYSRSAQISETVSKNNPTQLAANSEVISGDDEIIGPYETPASEQDFIEDDYLASVLSPDNTIQIGNNIYRLDESNERIYYTSASNTNLYDELIGNPTSPDIYWYPMDQNVFDLQDAGIEGEPATSLRWNIGIGSGIGCGPGADNDKKDGGVIYSKNQRLDCKVVYQKAGIYFSIIAKAQNQKKFAGIWWSQKASVYLLPSPGAIWEELCVGYSSSDFNGYSNDFGYGDGNTVAVRYYQSTRGLKNYDCSVSFSVGQVKTGPYRIKK